MSDFEYVKWFNEKIPREMLLCYNSVQDKTKKILELAGEKPIMVGTVLEFEDDDNLYADVVYWNGKNDSTGTAQFPLEWLIPNFPLEKMDKSKIRLVF